MISPAGNRQARMVKDQVFRIFCMVAASLGTLLLALLLIKLVLDGMPQLMVS